jgi:hypothetical protein
MDGYTYNPVTGVWVFNPLPSVPSAWNIATGKIFTVNNTLTLQGVDNQILDTSQLPQGDLKLGTAALQPSSAFQPAGTVSGLATMYNSSLTVGTGAQSLTVAAGLGFTQNMLVTITSNANGAIWMYGTVTSYNSSSGALVINVIQANGSGTYSGWTIAASGAPGATGATGTASWGNVISKSGSYSFVPGDMNNVFEFNNASGCTATLMAASSVTSGQWLKIKNIGAGTLSLSGIINGGTVNNLAQYDEVMVFSDGNNWYGNLTARSLSMNGEGSATSTAQSTLSSVLNVTAGDRIFVSAFSSVNNTSNGLSAIEIIQCSGPASGVFLNNSAIIGTVSYVTASTETFLTVSGIFQVTGTGTLAFQSYTSPSGGTTIGSNQLYWFFLKKQ